jgi:hypothetical protein
MHPDLKVGSDKTWQSDMVATLNKGVWEVGQKMELNSTGGGLWVLLSQRDAHVVAIYLTQ